MPQRHAPFLLVPLVFSTLLLLFPTTLLPTYSQAAQRTASGPESAFGIAGAMRWPDWGSFDKPADTLLDSGAAWVRADFAWAQLEPQEGVFTWEGSDRIVRVLNQRQISILGILSYAVNWATPATEDDSATGVSFYPPDLNKYYDFVHTMAARYKGQVRAWEVWNEPNSAMFWKPQPNPQQYADLLKTAYRAVKDADPSALVVSGGMSGNAVPFLEQVIAAGASNSFDVLGLHPYAVPTDMAQARVESSPETHKLAEVELPKYRAFLERHGLAKQIWVTEIGWPANDWQLDPDTQASYMTQAYVLLLGGGIAQKVFWYSFKDEGANSQQSWGLLGWGSGIMDLGQPRPAFAAYNTMARLLTGAQPAAPEPNGAYTVIDDFEQPATWRKTAGNSGSLTIAGGVIHGGAMAARIDYNFAAPNQSLDFAPSDPIAIPGQPTSIGAWIRGDSSGNYLSAWLRDAGGELFKLRLGAVDGASAGWRFYQAPLDGYFFPYEHAAANASAQVNGKIDYPVSLVALRLENTPDGSSGAGSIFVDDIQVSAGPTVNKASFTAANGNNIDILWSRQQATVDVTGATTVLDRSGAPISASDGKITVGPSPIYVIRNNGGAAPAQAAQAAECVFTHAAPPNNGTFFQDTAHNLDGLFREYWQQHGGVAIFGLPISEEFYGAADDGKSYLMQYFQRARFEYHPENATNPVMLSLLGVAVAQQRGFGPAAPLPNSAFVPETSHNIALLKSWWEQHGGIAVFGYPVSEEMVEQNPADGKSYTVQYFERNRIEYHPEYVGTEQEVLLGLLGSERLQHMGCLP